MSAILTKGRSPQGERGLKFQWRLGRNTYTGRSPQGERGLKYNFSFQIWKNQSRSPQGERGLKFLPEPIFPEVCLVALRKESVD